MSQKDWPGSVLSKTPVTPSGPYQTSTASGIWSMNDVAYWVKQAYWPTQGSLVPDPYFYDVSLLLTGDGTNGAQNNTFLDSSTNNFAITRNGNTTQGTFSPYGNLWSNYFGSGNYLTANNSALALGSNDFTIEAWCYFNTGSSNTIQFIWNNYNGFASNSIFFGKHTAGSGNVQVWVYNYSAGSPMFTDPTLPPTNVWVHYALVRNGSAWTLYRNGTSVATATYSGVASTNTLSQIGGNTESASYCMDGYISNYRMVNGTAVYTSNFTPPTAPLTAVTNTAWLSCQSNRFIDNSSNNLSITVNGSPSVQRFSPFNPTAPYSASTIGGSGYFDGSGDYLTMANSSSLYLSGDFTVEFWIYQKVNSNMGVFQHRTGGGGGGWNTGDFQIQTPSKQVLFNTPTGDDLYTGTYSLNCWNHVAFARQGTNFRCYLNGVYQATKTSSTNFNGNGGSFNIGRLYDGTSYEFNGYIADLRVNTTTALYTGTSTVTVPTSPETAVAGTNLLCNFTNAGIPDAAMMNDLETVGNAQVSTSVKKYGTGSLAFDGSGDYLYSPWIPGLEFNAGNFTIEFWVYINGGNSLFCWSVDYHYGMTWNYAGSSGNKVGVWASSNGSSWDIFNADGGGNGISTGTISTSTWTHVAWVRNGSSWALYLNGTSAWTGTSSATIVTRSTDKFRIGGPWPGAGPGDFNGYIDDLRITKGYARYTANFTPPTAAFPTF